MHCRSSIALLLSVALSAACAGRGPLPARAVALNDQGALALAAGELDVAEARLALALEYNDRFTEAWVNVGVLATVRGDFPRAERALRKAVRLNPDLPAPHHALGLLAERRHDWAAAIGHYRAALAVDPSFVAARENLGRRLFEEGRYGEAREQFARLVEIAPDRTESWIGLCEALLRLGRERDAEASLLRARAALGTADGLQLIAARLALRKSEFAYAEQLLVPLTSVAGSDQAQAWAWRGFARAGRDDVTGARAALHRALDLDPADPVATALAALLAQGE
jgi:tetratricopeptide (TPR) repeat protein